RCPHREPRRRGGAARVGVGRGRGSGQLRGAPDPGAVESGTAGSPAVDRCARRLRGSLVDRGRGDPGAQRTHLGRPCVQLGAQGRVDTPAVGARRYPSVALIPWYWYRAVVRGGRYWLNVRAGAPRTVFLDGLASHCWPQRVTGFTAERAVTCRN